MHPLHHPYFVKFIVYFNKNQDFFECHEVLEEYWKEQPHFSKSHPLTAYILLAVGLYHWRRNNWIGAQKLLIKAEVKMKKMLAHPTPFTEGIDFPLLYQDLLKSMHAIENGEHFQPFKMIITSKTLMEHYQKISSTLPLLPKNSLAVIDKHRFRTHKKN